MYSSFKSLSTVFVFCTYLSSFGFASVKINEYTSDSDHHAIPRHLADGDPEVTVVEYSNSNPAYVVEEPPEEEDPEYANDPHENSKSGYDAPITKEDEYEEEKKPLKVYSTIPVHSTKAYHGGDGTNKNLEYTSVDVQEHDSGECRQKCSDKFDDTEDNSCYCCKTPMGDELDCEDEYIVLDCGHKYHKQCLSRYRYSKKCKKQEAPSCPVCDVPLTPVELEAIKLSRCGVIQNWIRIHAPDKKNLAKMLVRQLACGLSAATLDIGYASLFDDGMDSEQYLCQVGYFYGAEFASWLVKVGLKQGLSICGLEDLAHEKDIQKLMRIISSVAMVERSKGYALVYGVADNHLPFEHSSDF